MREVADPGWKLEDGRGRRELSDYPVSTLVPEVRGRKGVGARVSRIR